MGFDAGDPYILGTQEPASRPYNPCLLGKDFATFCMPNGFSCTFHDLRHTFAAMAIAAGVGVRTVASYLGHASVSMALNTYADVDPDAKKSAVSKIVDAFDDDPIVAPPAVDWTKFQQPKRGVSFSVEQLEYLLAEAKRNEMLA